ncbi:MAG: hypothetical protein JNL11_03260 [Bdellovibrionaceae bacterium]|nr:hypothetical protein [Pseudobdellovibrionaceae bacterium]
MDAIPDDGERRFNQLLAVNFIIDDLESGGTTLPRFFRDIDEWLDRSTQVSSFEDIARTHITKNPKDPKIKFLEILDKENPMGTSPNLFEVLVRAGIRMKLPKRGLRQKVSHPKWLKGFARILAKDIRKVHPNMSNSEIAGIVNKELKSINPRLGTPDDVIRKMFQSDLSKA